MWQERLGLGPDRVTEQIIEATDDPGAIEQAHQLVRGLNARLFVSAGLSGVSRLVDGKRVLVWQASS